MFKQTFVYMSIFMFATSAFAVDEKIDPTSYICAELIASNTTGEPPIFEGLQIDGYAAAKSGIAVADSNTLPAMLMAVSDSCAAKPADTVLSHWQELRKSILVQDDGPWRADKATCANYIDNPDDASGFIIWLDGYNRGKTNKSASIFTDQTVLDDFLDTCKKNPSRLMLDVLSEKAK